MIEFIKEHLWALIFGLLGFIEVIVRLTPTQVDNSIFNKIKALLDILIPNRSRLDPNKPETTKRQKTIKTVFGAIWRVFF